MIIFDIVRRRKDMIVIRLWFYLKMVGA